MRTRWGCLSLAVGTFKRLNFDSARQEQGDDTKAEAEGTDMVGQDPNADTDAVTQEAENDQNEAEV